MLLRGAKYEWTFDPADTALVEGMARRLSVEPVLAATLVSRGIREEHDARCFLDPAGATLPDARLLPDADRVVERLERALERGEAIVVHGHDDADGVCATTIMVEALRQLGASPRFYVPDRRTEGHGLTRAEIDLHAAAGVTLIVTVDSCVSERELIAYAAAVGIDTIVTDHHEIPPELPAATAIVNPKLESSHFPYRYMAGVGVSLRLAELLLESLSGRFGAAERAPHWYGPRWFDEALALAAVGSIADKVPLTGDNRVIVSRGLAALPRTERPGLMSLLEESRLWGREVEPDDVRESLSPIFGRVSDGAGGNEALSTLLAVDLAEARARARVLAGERLRWRERATAAWRRVAAALAGGSVLTDSPAVILEIDLPVDVLGYVTSRLAEESGRPTVVATPRNGEVMAEARGPQGFNFMPALQSMSDLFLGYGGHPRAAGFSAPREAFPVFRDRMLAHVDANPPIRTPRPVDAELPLSDLTSGAAQDLDRLKPFGPMNGPAVLLARSATAGEVDRVRTLGLRFGTPVRIGSAPVDLIYRARHSDGVVLASIVDTIGHRDG